MSDWQVLISLLLGLVAVILAAYVLYSGLLSTIEVQTGFPPIKKVTIAYKFRKGPYSNCGPLFQEARKIGPKFPCIGVFYDDPTKVPKPQCRYAVGSILSEGESRADEELVKSYEASDFNVFCFPEVTHAVTTSFPYRTFLSILLGVMRVYPRMMDYIKKRSLCAHPCIEIYKDSRIYYMLPLARQEDFYVPETRGVQSGLPEREELHSDADVSGADSNSECSSESGVLLPDSRETSLGASSDHSATTWDQGDREYGERSSGGSSVKEMVWEQTVVQQAA